MVGTDLLLMIPPLLAVTGMKRNPPQKPTLTRMPTLMLMLM